MDFVKFGGILQIKTTFVGSPLFEKFLFMARIVSTIDGTGKGVNI
jgi:hypothetical protein